MKLIIGITGLHQDTDKNRQTIGAGKDAAAARLIDKHEFVRIGIADHLKRICKAVFDFSDEQLWGPSDERNKPDFRYPRGGARAADDLRFYEEAKAALEQHSRTGVVADVGVNAVARHSAEREKLRASYDLYASTAFLTPRYALQQLGTEWGRNCFDSVWIADALRTATRLLNEEGWAYNEKQGLVSITGSAATARGVVFSDVRFRNEFDAIRAAGGKLIRVRRFSWKPFPNTFDKSHQSETELLDYGDDKFDYIIDNGGDLNHLGTLVDRMRDIFVGRIIPYDEAQTDVPPALRQTTS